VQLWNRSEFLRAITKTLYQTAVEYLYELDMHEAQMRNELYLAVSQALLRGADNETELGPQRIRTLSYILRREFKSGRIHNLCDDPDAVQDSFAGLYGDWAYELPESSVTGLASRRAPNLSKNCKESEFQEIVDYRMVKDLSLSSNHFQELCKMFPIECNYVKLRDFLNTNTSTLIQKNHVERTLSFASNCSYLSDDALYLLLRASYGSFNSSVGRQYNFIPSSMQAEDLWPVLRCAEKLQGDMNTLLEQLLDKMPCGLLNMSNASFNSAPKELKLVEKVISRCKP
jgi:hypothetical protein